MGTGYLTAQLYTSRGLIPIEAGSVSVYNENGTTKEIKGFRISDLSGHISPIALEAPDRRLSQQPTEEKPFASYTLQADHPLYYTVLVKGVQLFEGSISVQNIEMIPLEENSDPQQRLLTFPVIPQNL